MRITKEKKMNKGIIKKLKPINLTKKNKQIKEIEALKNLDALDKESAPETKFQENNFSDNFIWQTKGFDAPGITRSETESVPLERTAEEAPIPNQNENNIKEIGTNYSTIQRSESSAYRISSDYEGRTTYDARRDGDSMRPTMGLGSEQRRMGLINQFVRPDEVQRNELEQSSRLEEQDRAKREEMQKLPFMQKRKEEEIF